MADGLQNMKTEKVLITGITLGLVLFSIFSLLDFDLYGGIASAILVGTTIGRLTDNNPVRYTIISIFAYNLIGWIIIALFDPDAKIVLGFENKAVVGLFISFILFMVVLYSIVGSFSALTVYTTKQHR